MGSSEHPAGYSSIAQRDVQRVYRGASGRVGHPYWEITETMLDDPTLPAVS
jgi:hypothetical protein